MPSKLMIVMVNTDPANGAELGRHIHAGGDPNRPVRIDLTIRRVQGMCGGEATLTRARAKAPAVGTAGPPVGLVSRAFGRGGATKGGGQTAPTALWIHDLESTRLRRLTSGGTATNAIWSRDGSAVTFSVRDGRAISMVSQPVDGDGHGHTLFSEGAGLWPGSWTPDGRALAYMTFRPGRTGGPAVPTAGAVASARVSVASPPPMPCTRRMVRSIRTGRFGSPPAWMCRLGYTLDCPTYYM